MTDPRVVRQDLQKMGYYFIVEPVRIVLAVLPVPGIKLAKIDLCRGSDEDLHETV